MKTINTTRFGEISILEEHLIQFKDGMIGFPKLKQYVLVESPAMPLILWLQSVDEGDIAFPMIEPYFFKKDYRVNLNDADKHSLGYKEKDSTKILVVMTIPEDMAQMTVNMKAPVVLDINQGSGTQIILQDKLLGVRTPAHETFSRVLSSFTIEQSISDNTEDSWSAVNVRAKKESQTPATI
jgi:flagellar assembly factor FliW